MSGASPADDLDHLAEADNVDQATHRAFLGDDDRERATRIRRRARDL